MSQKSAENLKKNIKTFISIKDLFHQSKTEKIKKIFNNLNLSMCHRNHHSWMLPLSSKKQKLQIGCVKMRVKIF